MQFPLIPHTLNPLTIMFSLSEPIRVLKRPVMHVSNVDLPGFVNVASSADETNNKTNSVA
jgi:hypothetical protein